MIYTSGLIISYGPPSSGPNTNPSNLSSTDDLPEGIVNLYLTADEEAKLALISVTQPIDLDSVVMQGDIIYAGDWS